MNRFHACAVITCCLFPLGTGVSQAAYTVVDGAIGTPAGTCSVKIWHETLGESEKTVTIEPGQTNGYNVSLRQ